MKASKTIAALQGEVEQRTKANAEADAALGQRLDGLQQALDARVKAATEAVPLPDDVALYIASVYALHYQVSRVFDPFHMLLLGGTTLVVAGSIAMAAAGTPMVWCLAVLALAPWVTVVGYETVGYRHGERVRERL